MNKIYDTSPREATITIEQGSFTAAVEKHKSGNVMFSKAPGGLEISYACRTDMGRGEHDQSKARVVLSEDDAKELYEALKEQVED